MSNATIIKNKEKTDTYNEFKGYELHNVKFAGVLKMVTESFITGKTDIEHSLIEMLKDEGSAKVIDQNGKSIKGPSLNEIKNSGKENATPFFRSLLINFGTFVIRRNFLRIAFLATQNENYQTFNYLIKNEEISTEQMMDIIDFTFDVKGQESINFLPEKTINKLTEIKSNFSTDLEQLKDILNDKTKLRELFKEVSKDENKIIERAMDITFSELGVDFSKMKSFEIEHPEYNKKFESNNFNSLIRTFQKQLNNFIKNNFEILTFGKDVWTEIGLKSVENLNPNSELTLITDGRFKTEFEIAAEKFPNLKISLIFPMKNGELFLDKQDKIMELYSNSNSLEEFITNISSGKEKLVMVAEELSTLLVLHNYLKINNPELINKNIDNDLETTNLGSDRMLIIENERGKLFELSKQVEILMEEIRDKSEGLTILSTISRGGKDTITSIMQNFADGKKFKPGLDEMHVMIEEKIEERINNDSTASKDILSDLRKDEDISKNRQNLHNFDFLCGTTLKDSYVTGYLKSMEKKLSEIDKNKPMEEIIGQTL